jgi:cell division protein FtsQ
VTSSAPTRAIDPRIRERRTAVLRDQGRRRLRWLLVAVAVCCTAGLIWLGVESPLLSVHSTSVEGARHESTEAVLRAAAIKHGTALMFLDTAAVAARVERLPWVLTASVHKSWPTKVSITVVERTPVAWAARPGAARATAYAIVDATGRVVADVPRVPPGLVQIGGSAGTPAPGARIAGSRLAGVVGTMPALLRAFSAQIVSGPQGVTIRLRPTAPSTEIRLGSLDATRDKLAAAFAVLARLRALHQHVRYIDVAVPSVPVTA